MFKGKKIDDDLFEELEEQLLIADVGMNTTVKIIENLTEKASRNDLKDGEALYGLLKEEMADILSQVEQPLVVDTTKTPYVILMVGVNGVGKTTTIGKLAKQFQNEGKKVMLAAGIPSVQQLLNNFRFGASVTMCRLSLNTQAQTVHLLSTMRLKLLKLVAWMS